MASPFNANFVRLPRLDTSFDGSAKVSSQSDMANLSHRVSKDMSRRNLIPRINTSPPETQQQELLKSATEAVAEALGVDANELPEPFYGLRPIRPERPTQSAECASEESDSEDAEGTIARPFDMLKKARQDSDSSVSVYSTPADSAWHKSMNQTIQRRLTMAVADVLGVEAQEVALDESFVELGGNHRTARELRANCATAGLAVKTKDIMNCKTIAELETCATPLGHSPIASDNIPPVVISDPESSYPGPSRIGDVFEGTGTGALAPPEIPPRAPARSNTEISFRRKPSRKKQLHDIEQVISLNKDVSRACVLKPRAGPLEGQLIAFITLAGCIVEGPDDCDIKLQNPFYTTQLPAIRSDVESHVSPSLVPAVWIAIEKMPLDETGNNNRRKLQTWVQNANDELYRQIISVESKEKPTEPTTALEKRLSRAVSKVLRVGQASVGMNQSFTKLGGDATTATQLALKCQSQGISIKPQDILQAPSLIQLASLATTTDTHSRNTSEQMAETFELSPMQRLYFHTSMGNNIALRERRGCDYRFNQSVLFRFKQKTSLVEVEAAIEAVASRHPMLRCRFRASGRSWCQAVERDITDSYEFTHHDVGSNEEVERIIGQAQSTINIERGPIFAARHFRTHDGFQMLFLLAHHLVVDLRSWRVIAEDLEALLTSGHLVSGRSLSFKEWTLHQNTRIQSMAAAEALPFDLPAECKEYWGVDNASNTYGRTSTSGFSLGPELTSILEKSKQLLRTEPSDIFMAALLLSFSQAFPDRSVPTLWNQEHERTALDAERDVSETVGWFTSLSPLAINVSPTDDVFNVIYRVKDSRREVSERGAPYFASNLKDADAARRFVSERCPFELIFTYANSTECAEAPDAILEQIPIPGRMLRSETSDIGPSVGRIAILEVSTVIDQGEARFKVIHHQGVRHQDELQKWIRTYERILRQAIYKLQYETPSLSLSDVPLLKLTPGELEQLNKDILPRLNLNISNIETIYPITTKQQSMLVNQSLTPGSSVAHMVYELDSSEHAVDIGSVCAAWQQVSDNHAALRSVLCPSASQHGLYDQVVLRHHSPSMLFLEADNVESAMTAIDKLPPLSLAEGIPWHRLIVCQAIKKTFLKLEVSQVICDMGSISVLMNELEQAYFNGQAPLAFEVSVSEYLECLKTTPVSIQYWREHLEDIQPCQFPVLISKTPRSDEWRNKSVDIEIPSRRLEEFTSDFKVHKSTVLKAAWALVLRTYIGTDQVCFGYYTSGRDLPVKGLRNAVGSFANVLTCRVAATSTESIAQLLLDIEESQRGALHHQHVSINTVEHELGIRGSHLFNSCLAFGYESDSGRPSAFTELRHIETKQASEYDINVDVHFLDGTIIVEVGHRILTSDQAANVGHAFGKAIETVLDRPRGTIKESDLFSIHDHSRILAWNSIPQVDVPKTHVHQLIATQSFKNPDIQAICAWDGNFTFGEMGRLSMILAKHLLASGLKPQTPVPVIAEKSRWAVIAMLAVLSAGAIVVPVDGEATSTFAWTTKAVGAEFVLATEGVRRYLDASLSRIVVVNDQTISGMSAQAVEIDPPRTKSHDIACILFSAKGSKNPKAVSYSHGALATACAGQASILMINPSSRVMQLSSYSLDIALSEVFTTLVNGGCVCIPSAKERIENFTAAAQRMNVNWTYMTPTLSRKLNPEALGDIAVVCFRAKHIDSDTCAPWAGKAKILLVYGSSEACPLGLSAAVVTDSTATPCFGNPFSGNFWIVSPEDNNRLMPVGALGELVIGGPTLASGFDIQESDIKAWIGKSTAHARSLLDQPGSRLLKTGQHVRYREQGEIEFVSVDGEECEIDGKTFRVSAVEPKLRQCLGRDVDVVVETIAFKDGLSPPILAAFIELGENALVGKENFSRLSRHTKEKLYLSKTIADMVLRETLPSHMIPTAYIPVKRMPLTSALKVDRRELQKMITGLTRRQLLGLAQVPNPQEVQAAGLKPLPLTQVEHRMRAIWTEVLGIPEESITASDGFIGLGGDMISGQNLVLACRKRGFSVSIADILRNVTLTELCRDIASIESPIPRDEDLLREPSPASNFVDEAIVPKLESDSDIVEDVAEASTFQTMAVESGMLQTRANINYFVLNISGSVDWQRLENACFLLAIAHPTLRTAFVSHSRQVYQTVIRAYRPEFLRYHCQSWRLGNLATKLIKREQGLPVDFRKPVTKFSYLDGGKSSILVMRISKAQYDDLSIATLVRDLSQFYQRCDRIARRPAFCELIRNSRLAYAQGATDYWKTLLDGARMTQVISQPALASANLSLKTLRQQIPTGSIQNIGIPFETILKGAWSIVLSNLSGTDDIVFGQLVEGKSSTLPSGQNMSDLVGPLSNIIPVRTRMPEIPITPYEYFRCIQGQHVASIPHEIMQTTDIIQKCTEWPDWTRFSTVIHHRNQPEVDKRASFTLGNATCKLSIVETSYQDADLLVETTMAGSASVDVSLTFCETKMQQSFADDVLKMLCSIVSHLTSAFALKPVLLKGLNDSFSTPRIPLPAPKRLALLDAPVQSVEPDQARAVHNVISEAWNSVLDAQSLKVPDIRSVPFYEIWGAFMPAAELARFYTAHMPPRGPGLERRVFTMEEIIRHPTMMQQYELIIAKQQPLPHLKHNKSFMKPWGKNFRKLTVGTSAPVPPPESSSHGASSGSGGNLPTGKSSSGLRGGRPAPNRSSSSLESLTEGSSRSDEEDLRGGGDPFHLLSLPPTPGHAKKPSSPSGGKGHKKGPSLLGRMMPLGSA
ncbi:hypothetical protein F4778DRAFT_477328 [Xylariomycetidae sp. FL2044]|nr:hypothetical protein F4778DRAFT_477328 [Xylariomycetidae sp. FL2044]